MARVLVDSNVLLDILIPDPEWEAWSSSALVAAAEEDMLVINPIIYAEVAVGFDRIEALDAALPRELAREPLPWEAAFLAGKAYAAYRMRGGSRLSPLPDFCIGAHAAIRGYVLLTRDAHRYQTYFPTLQIRSPAR